MPEVKIVYCQVWEESERGWGVRPDGYSLHVDAEIHEEYVKVFHESLPKEVPEEYSRIVGGLYACEVAPDLYDRVQSAGSIRAYNNNTPSRL